MLLIHVSGNFGTVKIDQAVDQRRSRYSDTTIILSLKANVLEISVRAWNTMLDAMYKHQVLNSRAEIPTYRSMNRYSLMIPTLC